MSERRGACGQGGGGEPRTVLPLRNLAVIVRTGRGGDDALTFEAAVVVSP